jgi:hypothetical protein
MKKMLVLAAAGEAAFGLVLLAYPPIVVRLLFAAEIAGTGIVMGRVAGIALIALGVACWPASATGSSPSRALQAMLCYSLLATLYLAYLGIGGEQVGSLLWPATVIHAILTTLLVRAWLKEHRASQSKPREPRQGI